MDIRIQLQTHYPAGYLTSKQDSDHLWCTPVKEHWSRLQNTVVLHKLALVQVRSKQCP